MPNGNSSPRPQRKQNPQNGAPPSEVLRLLGKKRLTAAADCCLRPKYRPDKEELTAAIRALIEENAGHHRSRIVALVRRGVDLELLSQTDAGLRGDLGHAGIKNTAIDDNLFDADANK